MLGSNNILLYTVGFLFAISLFFSWYSKRCAKNLLKQEKAVYSGKLQYIQAQPKDFPWTDESFYDDFYKNITAAEFRHVGNFECITLSKQYPGLRTYLMCFLGDGGTITAAAYHVKVRGLMRIFAILGAIPKNMKVFDFESEFKDNTFLCTNNLDGINPISDFMEITTLQFDPDTPVEHLLALHRESLQDLIEIQNTRPMSFSTKHDMLSSQDRMHEIKTAHKKNTGYVTRAVLINNLHIHTT